MSPCCAQTPRVGDPMQRTGADVPEDAEFPAMTLEPVKLAQ